jgi:hypothetical protein
MLTVVVGMPLRNSSGICIGGWIALGVDEQPDIAAPTATAIAAHIRDIGSLANICRPRIYTQHRPYAADGSATDTLMPST